MRSFILKILLFALPVCTLLVFVEIQLRSRPNVYAAKKVQLDSLCSEIEILCLGSSQIIHGINPDYFSKKVYNAANVSQSYDFDQKILEKYIDKMPELKTVVIPVSFFGFFLFLSDAEEFWRTKYYSLLMQVSEPDMYEDYMLFGIERQDLLTYWISGTSQLNINELGFDAGYKFEKRDRNLEKSGLVAAKRHTVSDFKRQSDSRSIIESMINLCESRNISVMLLMPPAHQSYRDNLNKQQLELTYSIVDSILQKHENIIFIDEFANPIYQDDDFFDADHLNDRGAVKLTKRIDNFLTN